MAARDDEPAALYALLALAAALYLIVWLVERPDGDNELPTPTPAGQAAADRA